MVCCSRYGVLEVRVRCYGVRGKVFWYRVRGSSMGFYNSGFRVRGSRFVVLDDRGFGYVVSGMRYRVLEVRASGTRFRVRGFGVRGFGRFDFSRYGVSRFGVSGSWFRVRGVAVRGFRGSVFRVRGFRGSKFRVRGLGCGVSRFGVFAVRGFEFFGFRGTGFLVLC